MYEQAHLTPEALRAREVWALRQKSKAKSPPRRPSAKAAKPARQLTQAQARAELGRRAPEVDKRPILGEPTDFDVARLRDREALSRCRRKRPPTVGAHESLFAAFIDRG